MKMEVAVVRAEEKHRHEIKAVLHVEASRRSTAVADAKAAAEAEYNMCIQVTAGGARSAHPHYYCTLHTRQQLTTLTAHRPRRASRISEPASTRTKKRCAPLERVALDA